MQFRFAHNNFNVRDLERSLKFYDEALGLKEVRRINAKDGSFTIGTSRTISATMSSISPFRSTISARRITGISRWAASALKIRQWASILSPTRTATGWRSVPQSKQKPLGAAALSVFFILLTGLFCSFFDNGCILLKLSPDERTVSFESLP